jgi:surfeit locus 1 family protein
MKRHFGFGVFTLLMVALFVGLGVWQLQRRVEKHALIAALSERLAAAPEPLPPVSQWATLTAAKDEFRRVSFTATYTSLPDAMVYTSGSGLREDISGPGTWAFVPARVPTGGTVVINAGFVPNTMQERTVQDRAVAQLITNTSAMFTGYIRFPESPSLIAPRPDLDKRLWFNRWPGSMARGLGWGREVPWGDLAPFYIDLETPVPASGVPKPGPLTVHLKDDHMQYAITWFTLAGAVAIAFLVWARGRRRTAPASV